MDEKDNLHGEPDVKPIFGGRGEGFSPRTLQEKEKATPENKNSDSAEKSGLFSGAEKPGRFSPTRLRGRFTRRKTARWVAAGVLGFGGVGIFSIVQGPLQAIH